MTDRDSTRLYLMHLADQERTPSVVSEMVELLRPFNRRLALKYGARFGGGDDWIDDLESEGTLALFDALPRFDAAKSDDPIRYTLVASWRAMMDYSVRYSMAISFHRGNGGGARSLQAELIDESDEYTESIEQMAIKADVFVKAMASLTPIERTAIKGMLDECGYDSIAAAIGRTPTGVRVIVARALEKMRGSVGARSGSHSWFQSIGEYTLSAARRGEDSRFRRAPANYKRRQWYRPTSDAAPPDGARGSGT